MKKSSSKLVCLLYSILHMCVTFQNYNFSYYDPTIYPTYVACKKVIRSVAIKTKKNELTG